MSQMLASLGDNQMFGAGFGLISIGLAATVARKGMQGKDCKHSCYQLYNDNTMFGRLEWLYLEGII